MSAFYPQETKHYVASLVAGCLITLSFVNSVHGQGIDQVLAHVDAETSVLVRIDPAAFDGVISAANQDVQDPEETVLQHRLKQAREILGGDPVWLTVGFPQSPLLIQILVRDPDGKRIEILKELWDFPGRYPYGPEPSVVIRELSNSPSKHSVDPLRLAEWKKLMAPGTDGRQGTIQFACLPPTHLYETYRELLTELPDDLGGGPVTILTDGLRRVSGAFDLKTGALESTVESASSSAATAFAERATQLLTSLAEGIGKGENSKLIEPLIQQLGRSVFRSNESQFRWKIPASENWQPEKMLELAFGSAANRSAMERLRNLSLGILNYESARQHLPPPDDSRGPDGPTSLSWRVHILPFIEQNELYQKFALDEPWDSPTNIKLLPQMPAIYCEYGSRLLAPTNSKPGSTTVVAPISENTILGAPRKVTFSAIVDGTSNTILLVIVKDSRAVPWTAPQGYVFDPDQPAAGLKFRDGTTPTAFCDGSCRQLVVDNDWSNLFEMNDGEVVEPK